jgi:hypothetical protein
MHFFEKFNFPVEAANVGLCSHDTETHMFKFEFKCPLIEIRVNWSCAKLGKLDAMKLRGVG